MLKTAAAEPRVPAYVLAFLIPLAALSKALIRIERLLSELHRSSQHCGLQLEKRHESPTLDTREFHSIEREKLS